jgi:GntR family transcriptional repressor for pyruvate dehydrogenase complex
MSEQVASQIVGMISAGKWKPGEKLPSEAELCRVLHVGRSTLREALKMLSFVEIVQMRVGDGTYVAQSYKKFLEGVFGSHLLEMEKTVLDLYEARLVLEPEVAALCAVNATDEDLRNLEDLVKQMQAHTQLSEERFLELEMSFHMGIAVAARNQVLAYIYQNVRGLIAEFIRRTQEKPTSREHAYMSHVEILNALKERKPDTVRKIMRKHVLRSKERLALHLAASADNLQPEEAISARG